MQEFRQPAVSVLDPAETTLDDLRRNARQYPDHVGFSIRTDAGWRPITYAQFADQVLALARGLIAAGVQPGDRVALMSRDRYEWTLCDYAIWSAGAVVVPIYETSSAEQVSWILSDSGAVAVFVELDRHRDVVESVRAGLVDLRHVWRIDDGDTGEGGIAALVSAGADVTVDELAMRREKLSGDSLATIVYTSGTTGRPKGCSLTHGNLVAVYTNVTEAAGVPQIFNERSSTLMFLPLAHSLARAIQLSCVHSRVRLGYTSDIKDLPQDLESFHPTLILAVPRVFEKLYNTAQRKAYEGGALKRRIFDRADDIAVRYSEARDRGGAGPLLRAEHAVLDHLVYSKIRTALGGQVRWSISGGAPLGVRLGHFFRGMGVTVLEGYGLTETAVGGTLNLPERQRIGSVGPPIPGCTARIAEDGEILLRGEFLYRGYWHDTAPSLVQDGWLHTGDIGHLDDDGFVTITGRKKELIVTSGGKNVAPTVLEDRLRAHWLVSQCMVVGDRRPYVACLVTLDPEMLKAWLAEHGKPTDLVPEAVRDDPELVHDIHLAVDAANEAVSKAESIRRFAVLGVDFTEAGGQLTPTLKLKRDIVAKQFENEVESLYA